jgi:hypothetical protein
MTDFELGFIIGLIEGEGCLTLGRSICKNPQGFSLHPRFFITNTNLDILGKAQSIIGGIIFSKGERLSNKHKQAYKLSIEGKDRLKVILPQIEPYLISKKLNCELLLEYVYTHRRRNGYSKRDIEIFEKIRILNKRG